MTVENKHVSRVRPRRWACSCEPIVAHGPAVTVWLHGPECPADLYHRRTLVVRGRREAA